MTKERGGKVYWYAAEKIGSDVKFWYIGRDCTETRNRVDRMNELREQAADRGTGGLLLAMAKVGNFRLGGTLTGTNAFRLMEGELGTTLPLGGVVNTGDVDIAQFERLSVALQDTVEPSLPRHFRRSNLSPFKVWTAIVSGASGNADRQAR